MEELINSQASGLNLSEPVEKRKKRIKNLLFGWVKDNHDKLFLFVLLVAFVIRIWMFTKTMDQTLWWDEADYMASSKNWAGFNSNLLDTWYYRRGFLWAGIGAVFFKIGLGEIGIRFLVVLMSTGIVAVSYFLIQKMFNKKLAILACTGLSLSWVYMFFTGRLLTEIPSTFFLLLFLLFFWKGYVLKEGDKFLYLSAVFCAFAVLIRMQTLMFLIPVLIYIFIKDKFKIFINKKLWITLLIFLLVLSPYFILSWKHYGNPIADLSKYYLGIGSSQKEEVGVQLAKFSDLFLYFNNLPYITDGNSKGYSTLLAISPMYVLLLLGIVFFFANLFLGIDKILKDGDIQKRTFIFLWIVLGFLFLGYMAPQLEQRYAIPILPFLFVVAAYPLIRVSEWIKEKFNLSEKKSYLLVFLVLILLLIPSLLFGNALTQSKTTSYLEVKQAGEWIKENSNIEDIVISDSLPQITYYAERPTYPFSLAYRRDVVPKNESDLNLFIEEKKPRYIMLSIFESHPEWAYSYPEKHQELLTPVRSYQQNEQNVLIIYEVNYN